MRSGEQLATEAAFGSIGLGSTSERPWRRICVPLPLLLLVGKVPMDDEVVLHGEAIFTYLYLPSPYLTLYVCKCLLHEVRDCSLGRCEVVTTVTCEKGQMFREAHM